MTLGTFARRSSRVLLLAVAWCAATHRAAAAEHHFGFTEESLVLDPGKTELTPWTTVRAGRTAYYSKLEGRLELGYGFAKNLQGSLFWNFSSVAKDTELPGASETTRLAVSDFESVSGNLKYKLSDPIADALGSALAIEGSYGPELGAVFVQAILDKQFGSLLLAGNVTGEAIWPLDRSDSGVEKRLSFGLSGGYFVTPKLVAGLEVRDINGFHGKLERSVIYLGPSVSWVSAGFWATFAVEPQLTALKGGTPHEQHLDLDENERVQARALVGFEL